MGVNSNTSGNLSVGFTLATGFSFSGWVKFNALPAGNAALWALDNGANEITLFGTAEATTSWYSTGSGAVISVFSIDTEWAYYSGRIVGTAVGAVPLICKKLLDTSFTSVAVDGIGTGVTPTTLRIGNDFNGQTSNACYAGWKIWTALLSDDELKLESTQLSPLRTRDLHSAPWMRMLTGVGRDYASGLKNDWTSAGTWVRTDLTPPIPDVFQKTRPAYWFVSAPAAAAAVGAPPEDFFFPRRRIAARPFDADPFPAPVQPVLTASGFDETIAPRGIRRQPPPAPETLIGLLSAFSIADSAPPVRVARRQMVVDAAALPAITAASVAWVDDAPTAPARRRAAAPPQDAAPPQSPFAAWWQDWFAPARSRRPSAIADSDVLPLVPLPVKWGWDNSQDIARRLRAPRADAPDVLPSVVQGWAPQEDLAPPRPRRSQWVSPADPLPLLLLPPWVPGEDRTLARRARALVPVDGNALPGIGTPWASEAQPDPRRRRPSAPLDADVAPALASTLTAWGFDAEALPARRLRVPVAQFADPEPAPVVPSLTAWPGDNNVPPVLFRRLRATPIDAFPAPIAIAATATLADEGAARAPRRLTRGPLDDFGIAPSFAGPWADHQTPIQPRRRPIHWQVDALPALALAPTIAGDQPVTWIRRTRAPVPSQDGIAGPTVAAVPEQAASSTRARRVAPAAYDALPSLGTPVAVADATAWTRRLVSIRPVDDAPIPSPRPISWAEDSRPPAPRRVRMVAATTEAHPAPVQPALVAWGWEDDRPRRRVVRVPFAYGDATVVVSIAITSPAPPERTYRVFAENRFYREPAEDRVYRVRKG